MCKRICELVSLFLFVCCLGVFSLSAEVTVRTTRWVSDTICVAFDFNLSQHEKISREPGGLDLVWHNAEVLDEVFDSSRAMLFCKIKKSSSEKPITYDMFYVVCGDTCEPRSSTGEIIANELLSDKEVAQIFRNNENYPSIAYLILMAFLGGLILNLMPCVFPIITLKIFSIAKVAGKSRREIRKETGLFASGIFSVFFALGTLLHYFSETMPGIGWGFFMQEPSCVFSLMLVFLACALHFLGIYHFRIHHLSRNSPKTTGAFFSGVLSGIASSSCVGPFAGVALAGAVLGTDGITSYALLFALSFGVALPYILLMLFPNLMWHIPKPGAWLQIFQNFMGYAMLASTVWIFSILISQLGIDIATKILLIVIAIVFLLNQLANFRTNKLWRYIAVAGVIALTTVGYMQTMGSSAEKIHWTIYEPSTFDDVKKKNKKIFLNFTADWCLNCKYNETVFEDDQIIEMFRKNDVVAIKCDWTKRDEKITFLLRQYNSISVPLYVLIMDGKTKILPNLLTKKNLIEAVEGKDETK